MVSFLKSIGQSIWPRYDEKEVAVYALHTDHNGPLVVNELRGLLGEEKNVALKTIEATYLLPEATIRTAKYHIVVVPGGWGRITSFAELVTHLYKQKVYLIRGLDSPTVNLRVREQENFTALVEDPHTKPLVDQGYKFIGGVESIMNGQLRDDAKDRLRQFFGITVPEAIRSEPPASAAPESTPQKRKVDEVKAGDQPPTADDERALRLRRRVSRSSRALQQL